MQENMAARSQIFKRFLALRRASTHKQAVKSVGTSTSYSKEPSAWERSTYKYFLPIQTRWSDNDQYGHVNNVVYYSYFDTVINHYLIKCCGLETDIKLSDFVGYMVDTGCSFRKPLSFPERVLAGLKVSQLGRSSVTYQVAIFGEQNAENSKSETLSDVGVIGELNFQATNLKNFNPTASAVGHCVHVFVNPETNASCALPDAMRKGLENIS
ncbi:uncharacterized protein [Apostichopus japonicus]|uniref:uncharacterized protein isoform X2 n=1 Tax=Stichopus japonicus TaxID=307972 RepID=UPI003AB1F796